MGFFSDCCFLFLFSQQCGKQGHPLRVRRGKRWDLHPGVRTNELKKRSRNISRQQHDIKMQEII